MFAVFAVVALSSVVGGAQVSDTGSGSSGGGDGALVFSSPVILANGLKAIIDVFASDDPVAVVHRFAAVHGVEEAMAQQLVAALDARLGWSTVTLELDAGPSAFRFGPADNAGVVSRYCLSLPPLPPPPPLCLPSTNTEATQGPSALSMH